MVDSSIPIKMVQSLPLRLRCPVAKGVASRLPKFTFVDGGLVVWGVAGDGRGMRRADGLSRSPRRRLRSAFDTKDRLDLMADLVDESSLHEATVS